VIDRRIVNIEMQETTTQIGRKAAIIIVAILSLAFLFAPAFPMLASHAAGTITVTTDKTSYSANATYVVSGTVSGANATGTAVSIVVTNSLNQVADQNIANVINGAYTVTLHAGGSAAWTTGTYTVTASWAPGVGSSVSSTTTFTYTAAVGTTSSGGGGGGTTTIITTVTSATTTVVSSIVQSVTTVNNPGTTVVTTVNNPGTTVVSTVNSVTTVSVGGTTVTLGGTTVSSITTVSSSSSSDTGLYVAILGVVIAIIAGAIAVMALRKK